MLWPVPALPCLIQQAADGCGLVSVDDQPWIAKKLREHDRSLEQTLKAIPDELASDSEDLRTLSAHVVPFQSAMIAWRGAKRQRDSSAPRFGTKHHKDIDADGLACQ